MQCTIVVPTIGRPSLDALLRALAGAGGPRPAELVLVDDRPSGPPLQPSIDGLPPVRVVRTGGGGPARARNLGWRTARTEWIAFLDDVVVEEGDPLGARRPPAQVAGPRGAATTGAHDPHRRKAVDRRLPRGAARPVVDEDELGRPGATRSGECTQQRIQRRPADGRHDDGALHEHPRHGKPLPDPVPLKTLRA